MNLPSIKWRLVWNVVMVILFCLLAGHSVYDFLYGGEGSRASYLGDWYRLIKQLLFCSIVGFMYLVGRLLPRNEYHPTRIPWMMRIGVTLTLLVFSLFIYNLIWRTTTHRFDITSTLLLIMALSGVSMVWKKKKEGMGEVKQA